MRDWMNCESCSEEYQVIGGTLGSVPGFCPFCGDEVVVDDEDEELEDEDE